MIRPPSAALVGFLLVATGTLTAQAPPPAPAVPASAGNGVPGRHAEEGRPFIRDYAPIEVGGAGQNWAIVQDARGVIYVGSQSGVLEFDGASWRLIETPELNDRPVARHRRRRPHLRRQRRRFRLPRAGCQRRLQLRVAGGSRAGGRAPVHRRLAHVRHQRRRGVPDRAGCSSAGRRTPSTVVPADVAVQPRLARRRPALPDRCPRRGSTCSRATTFRPLPGTAALGREVYPGRPALRRATAPHRHAPQRPVPLRRRGAHAVPDRDRRVDRSAQSLYRGLELPDGTSPFRRPPAGSAIIDRQGRRVAMHRSGAGPAVQRRLLPDASTARARSGPRLERGSPASRSVAGFVLRRGRRVPGRLQPCTRTRAASISRGSRA